MPEADFEASTAATALDGDDFPFADFTSATRLDSASSATDDDGRHRCDCRDLFVTISLFI